MRQATSHPITTSTPATAAPPAASAPPVLPGAAEAPTVSATEGPAAIARSEPAHATHADARVRTAGTVTVDAPASRSARFGLRTPRVGLYTRRPDVTVVIPTRNETGNIAALMRRLDAATARLLAEVIVVDDSDDDTPAALAHHAAALHQKLVVVHRESGPDRAGGLGTAVLDGIGRAQADWCVVMDADLQHPPELIPAMLHAAKTPGTDLVVASRYAGAGRADGLAGRWRAAVSSLTTRATKTLFAAQMRDITDPMSGYFAVRRDAINFAAVQPRGYKILLELVARSQLGGVREIPYTFGPRQAGESKASLREGAVFLRRLLALRVGTARSALLRLAAFLCVGASGVVVNTAVLWTLLTFARMHYLIGSVVATQVAVIWNFELLDRYVFGTRSRASGRAGRGRRFLLFWSLNAALLPLQLATLAVLVNGVGLAPVPANVVTIGLIFAARYLVSATCIFTRDGRPGGAAARLLDAFRSSRSARLGGRWDNALVPAAVTVALLAVSAAVAVERPGAWLAVTAILLSAAVAHLAGWRGRQLRLTAMTAAVCVAAVDYLSWRLSVVAWPMFFVGVPLLLAEAHAALQTIGLHVSLLPRATAPLRNDRRYDTYDILVLVPTVNEGLPVLEPTLDGILRARRAYQRQHPAARIRVAVCNDGAVAGAECSDAVIALAARLGVECVTRTVGGGAKAGNIEHARQQLDGVGDTLIVIFDADQIPRDDFFLNTVPPFADASVGWVQTGQYYRNRDNPVAKWADDQQSLFYRLLCPAKSDHDAAFICGTNVVLRASALDEIGGLPTDSVTEDFAASIMLAPRWRSIYLPGVMATGLGPVDMRSYLKQQQRWARGTLTALRVQWRSVVLPGRDRLRPAQRFQYALALTHYLCGLRDVVFLAAPVLYLTTGVSGVRGATLSQFLEHFVPYYTLATVAFVHAAWRRTSWRSVVIGFASMPALVAAAAITFAGRRGTFTITPKQRTGARAIRTAAPYGIAALACLAALASMTARHLGGAYWLAAFWIGYLLAMLAATLVLVRNDARHAARELSHARHSSPASERLRAEPARAARTTRTRHRHPRRRPALAAAVVVTLAAAVLASAVVTRRGQTPALAAAGRGPAVVAGHPLIGVSGVGAASATTQMHAIGATVSIASRTFEIGDAFDASWAEDAVRAHETPWLTLVLTDHGRVGVDASLTAVANGVDDAALTKWAKSLATFGKPMYLTMFAQVDRNYAASSAVARDGIPADAARAWLHARSLFRAVGATNAAWVWAPGNPSADSLYAPPPSAIDAVAVTLFEYPGRVWEDPSRALAGASARHPYKPLLLEVSAAGASRRGHKAAAMSTSRSSSLTKAQWLAAVGAAVSRRHDVAVVVYHLDGPYANPSDRRASAWELGSQSAQRTVRAMFAAAGGRVS